MANDFLQTFIFEKADIRGAIVSLEESIEELLQGHEYDGDKKKLLAEFVAANVLLASHIKFEGSLSLQAQSLLGLDLILAECTDTLHFRGILRGDKSIADMSFVDIFSQGILAITMTPKNGAPYQGVVPTQSNSLGECLQDYFAQSEQLPTWFYFSAIENRVTGFMLQAMPAQLCLDAETSAENWNRIVHLASTLSIEEISTLSTEDLLYRLYHEETVRLFEPKKVTYQCTCSVERMERGLLSLGINDLKQLMQEQDDIKTQCHFCNKEYHFSKNQIYQLIQGASQHKPH